MNKPIHYLLVGFPFAGKTTLSKQLEKQLGFARVNIDEVKEEFGFGGESDDDIPDEGWKKIFQETDRRLVLFLGEGKSVLNENEWVTKESRNRLSTVAAKAGFQTRVIYIKASKQIVRERLMKNRMHTERFDVPDSIFDWALHHFEEPTEDEDIIIYDTTVPLEDWITTYFH